jgi:hypothetical protein
MSVLLPLKLFALSLMEMTQMLSPSSLLVFSTQNKLSDAQLLMLFQK